MSLCTTCAEFGASNNLGGFSKQADRKAPKKLILVPTITSTGARAHVKKSDLPLTEAFLEGKFNHPNPQDRWYITPEIKNPEGERADPNFLEDNLQQRIVTSEGRREEQMQFWFGGPVLQGKINALFCKQMSFFVVDDCNNLQGEIGSTADTSTNLYPITMAQGSQYTKLVENKGSDQREHVIFAFDVARSANDAKRRFISASKIDMDLSFEEGLTDVILTSDAVSSIDALTLSLGTPYGTFGGFVPVNGLVLGDFVVTNITTPGAVVIDSVVENNGVYTLNFETAQTAADVLTLTVTRNGFDFTAVNALEVVVA